MSSLTSWISAHWFELYCICCLAALSDCSHITLRKTQLVVSCKTETNGLVGSWMDHLNVRRDDNPQSELLALDSVKGKGHIPVPQ